MRPGAYFPYRVALGAVNLSVLNVSGGIITSPLSIDAYSDESVQVDLEAELRINREGLQDLSVDGSGESGDSFASGIRIVGKESRRRELLIMTDPAGAAAVTLKRHDWVGTVSLQGVVLRVVDSDVATPGYASERGAVVAWSEDLDVHMDQREPAISGDHLDVRWASFKGDPRLRDAAADLFAIREEGELPVVYLNTDIQYAHAVLHSRGTHGARARIRDAIYDQIAHQVWSSLVGDALIRVRSEAREYGAGDESEILDGVGGWRARVIEDWAPYLVAGSDPIADLVGTETGVLLEALPGAIQRRFDTVRGFRGLVRDIETLGGS